MTPDLASGVIYLEAAGGAKAPLREVTTEIAMYDKAYVPRIRIVPVGSTVAFSNQDPDTRPRRRSTKSWSAPAIHSGPQQLVIGPSLRTSKSCPYTGWARS